MKTIPCPIRTAAQSPRGRTQTAILQQSHKISYASYDQLIDTAARKLGSKWIKKGNTVGIYSPNRLEYLILLPALWRVGAISCHLNTRMPTQTLRQNIKKADCRFLLMTGHHPFSRKIPGVKKIDFKEILSLTPGTRGPAQISLNQKTTILFTSGSSSQPKAVLHSYGNHYYNAKGSNENIPVGPGDRWLLSLPLYHVSGLGIFFRTIIAGGTVVIPQKDENLIGEIKKYQITHISLVTTQLYRLLQDPKNIPALQKLKAILLGGSAIAPNLLATAKKYRLPIYISYGLTEMASQVATSKKQVTMHTTQVTTLKYRQFKIARDGEILVKGKTLFRGYVDGKKTMLPLRKGGWFATGDLGRIDKQGNLTVVGRKDNMFISGGENIYPEEIERQLLRLPGVDQAVVVPQADPEFGQRPVAFIKGKFQSSKIVSQLEQNLPRFKIPRSFYAWPANLAPGIKPQRRDFAVIDKH